MNGGPPGEVDFLEPFTIRLQYRAARPLAAPLFNLRIASRGVVLGELGMLVDGPGPKHIPAGIGWVECHLPAVQLTPKIYDVIVFVRGAEGISQLSQMSTVARFRITDRGLNRISAKGPMALNQLRQGPCVYWPRHWRFSTGEEMVSEIAEAGEAPSSS